jgi:hypothetical protein
MISTTCRLPAGRVVLSACGSDAPIIITDYVKFMKDEGYEGYEGSIGGISVIWVCFAFLLFRAAWR